MAHINCRLGAAVLASMLVFASGCSDDSSAGTDAGPDGGDAGQGCTAHDMCVQYDWACDGYGSLLEDCIKGFSGMDCTMTQEFCEGIYNAGSCEEADVYMDPYVAQYIGGAETATCEQFCTRCAECHETYPDEFVEQDCGDYNVESDTDTLEPCIPKCEADAELTAELQDLAVPLSEFGCCQIDYFF